MKSLIFMASSVALLLFFPEPETFGSREMNGFIISCADDEYESDIHSLSEYSEENEESISRIRNQRASHIAATGNGNSDDKQVSFIRITSPLDIILFQDVIKKSYSLRAPPVV